MTVSYWVVMPGAGAGRRMTGAAVPKQYLRLGGRCVIEHALAPFLADPGCLGVVVVLAADDDRFADLPVAADERVRTTVGGRERRDSVLAGLRTLRTVVTPDTWILVHDAARPCLPTADLARLLQALPTAQDGALLALRVADTLKKADDAGRVVSTVPRHHVWRAQTPQAFRYARLIAALEAASEATDEASAVEGVAGRPQLVPGSPDNLKITEAADVAVAERILGRRQAMNEQRVGLGIDVHAFGPGDHVFLGGVRIPHDRGVVAHSDGDVLLHALCDALLGAAGLGDIGQHFPDTDPRWKGATSMGFVAHVLDLLVAGGWQVVNADLTLLAERPRLAPHRDAIRERIAAGLGVENGRVNLKATTTERLGYLGRGEGLAAEAVVLLERARS